MNVICLVGLIASLAADQTGPQGHPYKEEIQNGIKVVYNLKVPADKAFRNFVWAEDLVIGGETDVEEYILAQPTEIIADPAGTIYVLDYKDCAVKKYDPRGKFIARIGRKGQGPGEFEIPSGICLDEESRLLVGDMMANKIESFNSAGIFITSLKKDRLYRFEMASSGKLVIEYMDLAGGDSQVKRIRRLAVEEAGKARVVLYSRDQLPFAAVQNKDFRLEIPLFFRWDVTPDGRLYVGTANRYEIRAMTLDGRVLFAFTRDYDPFPIPPDIRSAALKQLAGSRLPTMPVDGRDFEEYLKSYPIFKSITADEKGRIWVELFQPENKNRTKIFSTFDVFSPEGVFLFSTRFETELAARPFFKNGCLYALRRDANGYVQAVRYRLPQGL